MEVVCLTKSYASGRQTLILYDCDPIPCSLGSFLCPVFRRNSISKIRKENLFPDFLEADNEFQYSMKISPKAYIEDGLRKSAGFPEPSWLRNSAPAQGIAKNCKQKNLRHQPCSSRKSYLKISVLSPDLRSPTWGWLGPVRRTPSKKYSHTSEEVWEQIPQGFFGSSKLEINCPEIPP